MSGSVFVSNKAKRSGGVLYSDDSTITIGVSEFQDNNAQWGGVLAVAQKGHVHYPIQYFPLPISTFLVTSFQFDYFSFPILSFLITNFQFGYFSFPILSFLIILANFEIPIWVFPIPIINWDPSMWILFASIIIIGASCILYACANVL